MSLNGDLLYIDKEYMEEINLLFRMNAEYRQKIIAFINNIPFRKIRQLLLNLMRSGYVSRLISKLVEFKLISI